MRSRTVLSSGSVVDSPSPQCAAWLTSSMVRRYITLLIFALWMGGFTFYTLFVIPTGGNVLDGGELDVGFITQKITNWLNWLGVVALAVLGWNARVEGRGILRWLLGVCWLAMVVTLIALFCIHPVLDGMLDTETHQIHGGSAFFNWHRLYMVVASLQWLAALSFMWLTLLAWKAVDRKKAQDSISATESVAVISQYKTD
jgi:hypothetical protein